MDGTTAASNAVAKTPFLDIVKSLAPYMSAAEIPAKIEGVTFGPDVKQGSTTYHTLWIANDNDFLETTTDASGNTIPNPNQFFVFGFTDADLGGSKFLPQQFERISLVVIPLLARTPPTSVRVLTSALRESRPATAASPAAAGTSPTPPPASPPADRDSPEPPPYSRRTSPARHSSPARRLRNLAHIIYSAKISSLSGSRMITERPRRSISFSRSN